jgi:hypothetical protein
MSVGDIVFRDESGPIQAFSWGRFVVSGQEHAKVGGAKVGKGKDIFLVGRKVRKWKEREGHTLTRAMVERALGRGVEVLVIGNGVYGRVQVGPEVIAHLEAGGISEVHVLGTPDACKLYNELHRAGRRVALLAHGTC